MTPAESVAGEDYDDFRKNILVPRDSYGDMNNVVSIN